MPNGRKSLSCKDKRASPKPWSSAGVGKVSVGAPGGRVDFFVGSLRSGAGNFAGWSLPRRGLRRPLVLRHYPLVACRTSSDTRGNRPSGGKRGGSGGSQTGGARGGGGADDRGAGHRLAALVPGEGRGRPAHVARRSGPGPHVGRNPGAGHRLRALPVRLRRGAAVRRTARPGAEPLLPRPADRLRGGARAAGRPDGRSGGLGRVRVHDAGVRPRRALADRVRGAGLRPPVGRPRAPTGR